MILVVCALLAELRYAAEREGVTILEAGVGPVEAAIATTRALERGRYTAVVNAGIGGGYRGSARVGDALLIADETLADFGLEGGGALNLPGGASVVERVAADATLLARCAPLASAGLPLGRGLTVAAVTTTDATAERLRARYGTGIESMEGFSVLRAAAVANVPAVEVRGISNFIGDRSASEWDFAAGARATARALDAVLDRLV